MTPLDASFLTEKAELEDIGTRAERANLQLYRKHKVRQAREVIKVAREVFGDRLAVAFSGGKDSLVALHIALSVDPSTCVIFNDTTVEFPENISYVRELARRWGFSLQITRSGSYFLSEVRAKGWASHVDRWCCGPFKEMPTYRFLKENNILAEVTGTRRTESIYRRSLVPLRMPNRNPYVVRIHPLYDWNEQEVWRYIEEHSLPRNPLYGMGYRRIGCWCCPLNGPSHYRLLKKTHPRLHSFLRTMRPRHPALSPVKRAPLGRR